MLAQLQTHLAWLARSLPMLWLLTPLTGLVAASSPPEQFRLAFSIGVIGELNRNDAKASTLAWGRTVLSQRNLVAETVPLIFDRADDLFFALQKGEVDAVTVLTDEFLAHPLAEPPDSLFLGVKNGSHTQQYVLLARHGSGVGDLAMFKGRSLELHQHARTSLAPAWIDTLLASQKLGLPESVFGKITRHDKVSRVINRVFFRQVDVCVVTRSAFETAAELNPQLRQELHVLATSEELVSSVFFFRPGFSPALRARLQEAMLSLHETVVGQQVSTVFQADRLVMHPLTVLDSARALVAEQVRLRAASPGKVAGKIRPGPTR